MAAALQATRNSGTAPLAVLFDSTSTTSANSGVDTFRQITYSYNFGDERGLNWAVSGQPKNTQAGGPIAAHVFDVPGTYVVKVRATDASGAYSDASVSITVQDPNAVYAGAKTVCISLTSDFTGCPSGATQQSTWPTGTQWNGKRWLLHAGQDFSAKGKVDIQDGNSGVQVMSFGTGAKPIVQSVGVGDSRPATAAFATDITIADLQITASLSQSIGSRVLFLRNSVTAAGNNGLTFGSIEYWAGSDPYRYVPSSAFYNAREIFVIENNVTGSAQYTMTGDGSRVAVLGNTMKAPLLYHVFRAWKLNKSMIAHNNFGAPGSVIYHSLKLHSNGLSPYQDAYVDGKWATSKVVVANNTMGDATNGSAWLAAVCPTNDQLAEGVEDVVVENNRFIRGPSSSVDLAMGGRDIDYRGNVLVSTGGAITTGIGHTAALPAAWKGPYFAQ
jgi:hypothetical protein